MLNSFHIFYLTIKQNRWYWYFSFFCRFTLALGFILAGITKVLGERFASGLSEIHPMGAYLTALHETGYYYTFIGIAQIVAALLLLIPRTVVLGALLYFPIIINICILSYAVRFEGSLISAPLMVLANLFLLVWHYDRLQYILPFKSAKNLVPINTLKISSNKFPTGFFSVVLLSITLVIVFFINGFSIVPRNSFSDCESQFKGKENNYKGVDFCKCVHQEGKPLKDCLSLYEAE